VKIKRRHNSKFGEFFLERPVFSSTMGSNRRYLLNDMTDRSSFKNNQNTYYLNCTGMLNGCFVFTVSIRSFSVKKIQDEVKKQHVLIRIWRSASGIDCFNSGVNFIEKYRITQYIVTLVTTLWYNDTLEITTLLKITADISPNSHSLSDTWSITTLPTRMLHVAATL